MIKMVAGVYGMPIVENGRTRVVAKGPNSGPFSIAPEREAELVAKKLAVYVSEANPEVEDVVDEAPADDTIPELPELPDDVVGIPEYSTENTVAELREIGKLCGLTFPVGMKKADMVAALDSYIAENMEDEEPAPSFDASEAVL